MKRFVAKIIIFLVVFKMFDSLIYSFFLWERLADISPERDYGSLNRMYLGLINADVVAFGSSRVYLHINPEVLQETTGKTAWNMAMDGSNFEQHYFTLEEYLLHNKTPQVVIFEADLASLDSNLLRFKKDLFLPYRNYSAHTTRLLSPDRETQLSYWIVSSTIYKQEIPEIISDPERIANRIANGDSIYRSPSISAFNVKLETNSYILINGAQIKKGQIRNQLPEELPFETPQRHFDFSTSMRRMQAFEVLAQLAEEKGFVLVLLMSPYLEGEVEESQRRLAENFYVALSEKYANTYFLDFSTAEPFAHDLALWWNVGHLSTSGANLLSNKVGQEVNQILAIH